MIESVVRDEQLGALLLQRKPSRKRFLFRSVIDTDDRGWSPLHVGARKGDIKMVKQLLGAGMDVNMVACGPKSEGVTPLHLAAQGGHVDVMDVLLEPVAGPRSTLQRKEAIRKQLNS